MGRNRHVFCHGARSARPDETIVLAEAEAPHLTIWAFAAGNQRQHGHARPHKRFINTLPHSRDHARALVTQGLGETVHSALQHARHIRAADTGVVDANHYLAGCRHRVRLVHVDDSVDSFDLRAFHMRLLEIVVMEEFDKRIHIVAVGNLQVDRSVGMICMGIS